MHTSTCLHLGIRALLALLVTLALLPLLAPAPARAAGPSCTVNSAGGADYTSIQAAVDDTGCTTISVAAGTYAEHVTIARDVTISGAGASSTTVDGTQSGRVFSITSSTVTLQNLTIANGLCSSDCNLGGGLYNDGGTVNVNHSIFSANSATCSSGCGNVGGAIANQRGVLNVSNSTFAGNSTGYQGGGIANFSGSVTVSNSTFSGNSAGSIGGGIFSSGSVTVSNSTFAGNSANNGGGGIYNLGNLTVSNSTFAGNSAGYQGGGIDSSDGSTTLKNTIVANSSPGRNCYGPISADSHTLASDGSCGGATVKSSTELNLGPLANNGGPTQTIALLPGSAAIDTGDDTICAAAPVNNLDQRGVARPQGTHCDIGAFEVEQADTTAPTITISSPADRALYLLGQSVAASYACQDEQGGSGLASCTGTVASGASIDTSSVGSHTFSVQAADNAGNTASKSVTYQVIYNWAGFFQPVDNAPTVNSAKAGSAIPVKFSLGGDQGLNIFASGYPKVQQVACGSGSATDEIEQTVTAGASGLSYDATTNTYSYTWKTDKKWAGSCRQLVLKLADGTEHIAGFQFK